MQSANDGLICSSAAWLSRSFGDAGTAKHDDSGMNRHRTLSCCLSIIFSKNARRTLWPAALRSRMVFSQSKSWSVIGKSGNQNCLTTNAKTRSREDDHAQLRFLVRSWFPRLSSSKDSPHPRLSRPAGWSGPGSPTVSV